MRKSDMVALVEGAGLKVEGNETIAELAEALGYLVKGGRS